LCQRCQLESRFGELVGETLGDVGEDWDERGKISAALRR
jgi:hypothetical protein